jgi:mannose-6-phosphate isomerase-like protein (cupin superfamily)
VPEAVRSPMKNVPFTFRGTRMTIRLTTAETGGAYALIEMQHPANVGPALHIHPRGPEAFYILAGEYTFHRGEEIIFARPGNGVVIPAGVPHRYRVGSSGGLALVVAPPGLEHYFFRIAGRLSAGPVSLEEEFAVAAEAGQEFVERSGHWGAD